MIIKIFYDFFFFFDLINIFTISLKVSKREGDAQNKMRWAMPRKLCDIKAIAISDTAMP